MRTALGWVLAISGIVIAVAGFADAAAAWWSQPSWWMQPSKTAAATPASGDFPSGFSAILRIPRLQTSLYVVDAATPRDLRRGPGYIGAVRPGQEGNCIIAGHRDLHFRVLKDIKVGDEIELQTKQGYFRFKVASTEIVAPANRLALTGTFPQQVTLVTCFPFYYIGPAPKRFIVKAYRLDQSL